MLVLQASEYLACQNIGCFTNQQEICIQKTHVLCTENSKLHCCRGKSYVLLNSKIAFRVQLNSVLNNVMIFTPKMCNLVTRSSVSDFLSTVKGKAIPLQAWTGPEGSRRLRLPDFKTIGT